MSCKWVKTLADNGNVILTLFHNCIPGKTDQTADFKYKQFVGFQQIYAVYCTSIQRGGHLEAIFSLSTFYLPINNIMTFKKNIHLELFHT